MDLKDKLFELAGDLLIDESYFVVEVKVSAGNKKIVVIVDGDEGVDIDKCADLSRKLGEELDALIEGSYTLDVTSPGVDQPLQMKRQYVKNTGRPVKVKLSDGNVIKGKLLGVQKDGIEVEDEKKKVKEVIKFSEIDWTKVRVSFK